MTDRMPDGYLTNEPPREICCVCGHPLEAHVEETREVWFGPAIKSWHRCHCMGPDGFQCECRLINWADSANGKSEYDVDKRVAELRKQEGWD